MEAFSYKISWQFLFPFMDRSQYHYLDWIPISLDKPCPNIILFARSFTRNSCLGFIKRWVFCISVSNTRQCRWYAGPKNWSVKSSGNAFWPRLWFFNKLDFRDVLVSYFGVREFTDELIYNGFVNFYNILYCHLEVIS